jgi:hypothetical protein
MAHGESLKRAYNAARLQVSDAQHVAQCLRKMDMNPAWGEALQRALHINA